MRMKSVVRPKSCLSYEELTDELRAHGFYFQEDDLSWRSPDDEVAASFEALRDVCEIYPSLTRQMLKILLDGFGFHVSMDVDGYEATIRLRPQVVEIVNKKHPYWARPVFDNTVKSPRYKRLHPLQQLAKASDV